MMRKNITRTLTRSTVSAYRLTKAEGKPTIEQLEPLTAWGKLTEKEAEKLVSDTYGRGCMVDSIVMQDETYCISVDKFVENAVKVEQTEIQYEDTDSIPNAEEPLPVEE